jgi:hypothetical protein
MAHAPHTPESLRALIVEFAVAMIFTYVWWRSGLPMRGISRKDGPLPKPAKWAIAVFSLALFLLLAFLVAAQRKQMGLPVF